MMMPCSTDLRIMPQPLQPDHQTSSFFHIYNRGNAAGLEDIIKLQKSKKKYKISPDGTCNSSMKVYRQFIFLTLNTVQPPPAIDSFLFSLVVSLLSNTHLIPCLLLLLHGCSITFLNLKDATGSEIASILVIYSKSLNKIKGVILVN